MKVVELTIEQPARSLEGAFTRAIIGVEKSSPLVPQARGELPELERDQRVVRAEHRVPAVTLYLEVGAS
jgi:hypothetical protein